MTLVVTTGLLVWVFVKPHTCKSTRKFCQKWKIPCLYYSNSAFSVGMRL